MKFVYMTWSPSHYFDREREKKKKKKALGIRQSNQVQRQYFFVF